MNYLKVLDNNRTEWKRYLFKMGAKESDIEDIIQDSYLRVHQYGLGGVIIKDDGTPNKSYFWRVLQTVFHKAIKMNNKQNEVVNSLKHTKDHSITPHPEHGHNYTDKLEERYSDFHEKLYREIDGLRENEDTMGAMDIFLKYSDSHSSDDQSVTMRKLRDETGCTLWRIFTDIHYIKDLLSSELIEEYNSLKADFE